MSTTAASTIYNFGIIDNYHHHHHPNNHQHSLNQQNNKRGLTVNFLVSFVSIQLFFRETFPHFFSLKNFYNYGREKRLNKLFIVSVFQKFQKLLLLLFSCSNRKKTCTYLLLKREKKFQGEP